MGALVWLLTVTKPNQLNRKQRFTEKQLWRWRILDKKNYPKNPINHLSLHQSGIPISKTNIKSNWNTPVSHIASCRTETNRQIRTSNIPRKLVKMGVGRNEWLLAFCRYVQPIPIVNSRPDSGVPFLVKFHKEHPLHCLFYI